MKVLGYFRYALAAVVQLVGCFRVLAGIPAVYLGRHVHEFLLGRVKTF